MRTIGSSSVAENSISGELCSDKQISALAPKHPKHLKHKGGPNSVSKNHINSDPKNEPKTSSLFLLVLVMTIFPFLFS